MAALTISTFLPRKAGSYLSPLGVGKSSVLLIACVQQVSFSRVRKWGKFSEVVLRVSTRRRSLYIHLEAAIRLEYLITWCVTLNGAWHDSLAVPFLGRELAPYPTLICPKNYSVFHDKKISQYALSLALKAILGILIWRVIQWVLDRARKVAFQDLNKWNSV